MNLSHPCVEHPTPGAIREAFLGLPRRASLEVSGAWGELADALRELEACGAIAIGIRPDDTWQRFRATAIKGKSGPCYETGRTATYTGGAAAAMDDDNHLLSGAMRVCEKTGGLYGLAAYRGLISVTEADAALLRRLDTDPVPFDCNTFERDAEALAARWPEAAGAAGEAVPVLYAGPFRMLVLEDGALLRRGQPTWIGAAQRDRLARRERVLDLPPALAATARPAESYPARYRHEGAVCLLGALAAEPQAPSALSAPRRGPADLSAVDDLPCAMWKRLNGMIERGDPYFILSGSDPAEAGGCCPCDEVGEANRLVEAGILCRFTPAAHPDACTTAVYAFAGEIALDGAEPRFTPNASLRAAVAERL